VAAIVPATTTRWRPAAADCSPYLFEPWHGAIRNRNDGKMVVAATSHRDRRHMRQDGHAWPRGQDRHPAGRTSGPLSSLRDLDAGKKITTRPAQSRCREGRGE